MDNCLRPSQQLTVIANAIAVAISKNLTAREENILGNLITLVGASMLSIAAIDEAYGKSGSARSNTGENSDTTTIP
jgi:hypothetical protein